MSHHDRLMLRLKSPHKLPAEGIAKRHPDITLHFDFVRIERHRCPKQSPQPKPESSRTLSRCSKICFQRNGVRLYYGLPQKHITLWPNEAASVDHTLQLAQSWQGVPEYAR